MVTSQLAMNARISKLAKKPTPEAHVITMSPEAPSRHGALVLQGGHRARCSCHWASDCYALISDTQRAIKVHLRRSKGAPEDVPGVNNNQHRSRRAQPPKRAVGSGKPLAKPASLAPKTQRFNGKPMNHWETEARKLVLDVLVRHGRMYAPSEQRNVSLIQKIASRQFMAIAQGIDERGYFEANAILDRLEVGAAHVLTSCLGK